MQLGRRHTDLDHRDVGGRVGADERCLDSLAALEPDFRRRFVPPSTRDNPYPPADVMAKLKDISLLERVEFVMKDGKVYKSAGACAQ